MEKLQTHRKFYEELIQLNINRLSQEEYSDAVSFLYNKYFPTKEKGDTNASK